MKTYPTEQFTVFDDDGEPRYVATIPTLEAIQNFTSYLEPEELIRYNEACDVIQLNIALSTNPFNAFKNMLG